MKRVAALMQDILAYSELAATPKPRTLVPVQESLEIALANLQDQIEQSGAEISAGALPDVVGDRTQMAILFQNLLGNALKYRGDAAPRIRIEAMHEVGDWWRVSVTDNGQGFEAPHAMRISEPFQRLHNENVPGSGIGLATCKRIIERMRGRIWAESTPGEGSTFYFTLPD